MKHESSVSGMGWPVQAIRVINEKPFLLIMVGINIILSFGKEYEKLMWNTQASQSGRIGISDI